MSGLWDGISGWPGRVRRLAHRVFEVFATYAVVAAFALALAGCAGESGPTPTPTLRADYRIALVTNAQGTIRDGTFNELAYNGARLAGRDFGLSLKYRETIEDKDYPQAIAAMIADGHNIVITVGFQMQADTVAAAQTNPAVYFIGVDQGVEGAPPNFVGLQFAEDEGGFLAGALAGMMTQTNVVGVVAGMQIPPVERFVRGFINGVRYVNPAAKALSVFTPRFDDVQRGRSEADQMLAQNADVIFGAGGLTGSSAIVRAAERGAFVIGVDQDEFRTSFKSGLHADRILTSAVKGVDTGVYTAIANVLKGKFEGGTLLLTAADCGISYAPFNLAESKIPEAVKERLEAIWRALAGGTLSTGAATADQPAPTPLAPDALPPIDPDAPRPADCRRS